MQIAFGVIAMLGIRGVGHELPALAFIAALIDGDAVHAIFFKGDQQPAIVGGVCLMGEANQGHISLAVHELLADDWSAGWAAAGPDRQDARYSETRIFLRTGFLHMSPDFHRQLNILPRGESGNALIFRHCGGICPRPASRPRLFRPNYVRQIPGGNFV